MTDDATQECICCHVPATEVRRTDYSKIYECPRCKGEKHEDATDYSDGAAFAIERFICESCGRAFTYEDVVADHLSDIDELESTGCEGDKTFVPRPPKRPTSADDPKPRIEGDFGATMRAYREERERRGGVPMYPEDNPSSDPEQKDHDSLPIEKGWSKPEPEKARETSSAWWTAIKWVIGVGASIGLGWLAEWAFF